MKKSEYARMAEYEKTYWWHIGRLKIIRSYITKSVGRKKELLIMNIGCGTGGTIDMLESLGTVDNVDISDEAIAFMKKSGYKRITKVDDIKLPFKSKTYDLVAAFDVLEHIEDHVGALKEWKRILKDDGSVVITVPAYQWLWSDHDVSLYHKRRYTRNTLRQAAKASGLKMKHSSYAIVFSLPLVVGFRYLSKLTGKKTDSETSYVKVSDWMNKLFANLLYIEAGFQRRVVFPAGTTVIAELRKS